MWSYNYTYPNYLAHYGVLGMKWGARKYRNEDGTLTEAEKRDTITASKNGKKTVDNIQNYLLEDN